MKRDEILRHLHARREAFADDLAALQKLHDKKQLTKAEWRDLEKKAERDQRADNERLVDPASMTDAETARVFGVNARTVSKWKNRPGFPAAPGKRSALKADEIFRYFQEDAEARLARARAQATPEETDREKEMMDWKIEELKIKVQKMITALIPREIATTAVHTVVDGTGGLVDQILHAVCPACRDTAEQIWTDGHPALARSLKNLRTKNEEDDDGTNEDV